MLSKLLQNTLLLSLIVLFSSTVFITKQPVGVEEGKLDVAGRIRNENKKNLDSARILVKDSSGRKVLHEYYTDSKGKFRFGLDYNQKVRVYFQKEGYVEMFASFDTKVPSTKTYKTLYYEAAIALLSDSAAFNKQAAKVEPFLKVAYNSGYEIFIEDIDHTFAFLDQVTEPNIGKLKLTGAVVDSTSDSLDFKIEVLDSLGRLLSETKTDAEGNYSIEVPLMNKTKLSLLSENHHPSFTTVEGFVPEGNKEDFFSMKHDFIAIPKTEKISSAVTEIPQDKIIYSDSSKQFGEVDAVREEFEYAVEVTKRRLVLTGIVRNENGDTISPLNVEVLDGDALYNEYEVKKTQYKAELPYQSIVRVNFKAKGYHPVFVSLNTNMDFNQMDSIKQFDVPVSLTSKDNTDINPDAFDLPAKKFYYDNDNGTFKPDTAALSEFEDKLKSDDGLIVDTAVSTGFLNLEARVFDPATNDKIEEGRVRILNENKAVVSSITTDKKGRFSAQLGLNKIYYLEFEKDNYYPTTVKFNTQVPEGKENTDITQGGLRAPIVHKENEIFGKPIPPSLIEDREVTAYYFSEEDDLFIEDMTVYEAFMEDVRNYVPPTPDVPKPPKDTVDKPVLVTNVDINGLVLNAAKIPLDGLSMDFFDDGKKIESIKTDEQGKFAVTLPLNKNLTAELSKKDYHTETIEINTKAEETESLKNKTIAIDPITMYAEDNLNANPAAFALKSKRYVLNTSSGNFDVDEKVESSFKKALAVVPDNQKVLVEGKTEDAKGKSVPNALIMVYEGASLIDSVRSDNRGNYELLLPYQKDYRVVMEDKNFYRSYAAVSTKTKVNNERLVDKKIKGLDLVIVNRKEAKVNPMAFLKPFARVKFDADKDEFVEVDAVQTEFLANLFIEPKTKEEEPEEEEESKNNKDIQLVVEKIDAKQNIAERVSNENQAPATTTAGIERQKQQKTNRNLAAKSKIMGDFHNMMQGVRVQKARSMRDVNLDMERILNTGYTVAKPPEQKVNENMVKALETRQMLNQVVAEALGFKRTNIPPVSTDSIFDINHTYRMKHVDEGFGVYKVKRDWVYQNRKVVEYVREQSWWIFYFHYKNGKRIDDDVYERELEALKAGKKRMIAQK